MKVDAIIVDMDGTAVQYPNKPFFSSWDALAHGLFSEEEKNQWFALTKKYYSKDEVYPQWFGEQVAMLEGKSVNEAAKALFPIPYSVGFYEFFSTKNNFKKAILSAGIDLVAKEIAKEFEFDACVCQVLETKNGLFTGRGKPFKNLDKSNKLLSLVKDLEINLDKICYIGDTPGDISCFELVKFPVAFNPRVGLEKYVLEKNIPVISDFRELNEVLK